jgi:hypothetical protein
MDFRKKFLVGSHVKFKISNIDPAYKDTHDGQQSVVPGLARHIASLARLQYRLYAEGKRSLLIMLRGGDSMRREKMASSATRLVHQPTWPLILRVLRNLILLAPLYGEGSNVRNLFNIVCFPESTDARHACAFAMLSNAMTTIGFGGFPSKVAILPKWMM